MNHWSWNKFRLKATFAFCKIIRSLSLANTVISWYRKLCKKNMDQEQSFKFATKKADHGPRPPSSWSGTTAFNQSRSKTTFSAFCKMKKIGRIRSTTRERQYSDLVSKECLSTWSTMLCFVRWNCPKIQQYTNASSALGYFDLKSRRANP